MTTVFRYGISPWSHDAMRLRLEEFAPIYAKRPISDNAGGMSSSHLFLLWFILQHLKPKVVIESGVWKGQGTWLIEQACDAQIYAIDINWRNLEYRSSRAKYLSKDISTVDWSHLPKSETLVFIDDHIDAIDRCRWAKEAGFKHLVVEDNYPPGRGDCYSLQEVFAETGHRAWPGLRARMSRMLGRLTDKEIPPNSEDAAYMRQIADVYEVMPPIYKLPLDRWGEKWQGPEGLLTSVSEPWQQVYYDEAKWYTWLCYLHLS
jgi:hypothetical protein